MAHSIDQIYGLYYRLLVQFQLYEVARSFHAICHTSIDLCCLLSKFACHTLENKRSSLIKTMILLNLNLNLYHNIKHQDHLHGRILVGCYTFGPIQSRKTTRTLRPDQKSNFLYTIDQDQPIWYSFWSNQFFRSTSRINFKHLQIFDPYLQIISNQGFNYEPRKPFTNSWKLED